MKHTKDSFTPRSVLVSNKVNKVKMTDTLETKVAFLSRAKGSCFDVKDDQKMSKESRGTYISSFTLPFAF
jgi:hypothetical protein